MEGYDTCSTDICWLWVVILCQLVEKVDHFTYLGSRISDTIVASDEVNARIGKANGAFSKLKIPLWDQKYISTRMKNCVYNAIVTPKLIYGSETWALLAADMKKPEVFQRRCLRKILGLSLSD